MRRQKEPRATAVIEEQQDDLTSQATHRLPADEATLPRLPVVNTPTVILPGIKVAAPAVSLKERLTRWLTSPQAYPLKLFVASRVFYIVLTYGVLALLTPGHGVHRGVGSDPSALLQAWDQWDVKWYIGLAEHGYAGFRPGVSSAFFPLMPLAMKVMSAILSLFTTNPVSLPAGMLVSNAAFLGAMVVLYHLVSQEWDAATAQRAVLYMAVFPKALFTFAAYSESLFLLVFIASYYFLRRNQFVLAALFAGLAMLGRFFGIVLIVPFLMELLRYCGNDLRKWLRYGWTILAIPAALAGYMAYLYITLGNALAFFQAEIYWKRHFVEPIQTLFTAFTTIGNLPFASMYQFDMAFDLCVVIVALALLIAAFTPWGMRRFRLPLSLTVLSLLVVLIPISDPFTTFVPGYINSTSRLVLPAFGVFILLARLTERRPRWHEMIALVSLGFLVLFTAGFVLGDYVV
jgi:Gpi18-like mannosyltransferase